jgi:hypothetical protein
VGPTRLFGCLRELLPLVGLRDLCVSCCQITLQGFKMTQVSTTLSDMSGTCPLQSFSSNVTFIMLIILLKIILVDYFVVMVYDNHYCFDTFACID